MPKNALQAAADQYWFSHGRFVAAEGDQRIACAQAFLAGARCSIALVREFMGLEPNQSLIARLMANRSARGANDA